MTDTDTPKRGPALISHSCGRSWTGLNRAHCPACHETFNSDGAAERHRSGPHGARVCLPPSSVGLVASREPWGLCWKRPGSWPGAVR